MRNLSSLRFSAIALTLLFAFSVASRAEATNGSRALITSAVNENDLVTLSGNTRPEAIPANDRGAVSGDLLLKNMQLQLRRPAEQEKALETYIDNLQKPGAANYHQWLTAEQYGRQYGLNKSDLAKVSSWLQSHGFTVNLVYASGMVIDFTGTVAMVRQAFHTDIHNLEVNGQMHVANMSDPKIPAALAPAVVGVGQLHDFKPNTMFVKKTNYTTQIDGATYYLVLPADLATIYNLNPLFAAGTTGEGQTVVVVEDSNMLHGDWVTFRSILGLSSYTSGSLELVHPASSGTNNCFNPGVNGDSGEASIDAEYASSSAPGATIEMATCQDTFTFGGLIAIENILNASSQPPAIISMSYGICEATGGAALNSQFYSTFQQAVSEGVSVFVSAGDAAAAGCGRGEPTTTTGIGITGWGETPYNVAVGGTDFGDSYLNENSTYWSATNGPTYGSALSYVPEVPWNDSCASDLISSFLGYPTPWDFCRSSLGTEFYNNVGGSGGPSACATGTPSTRGVVSGTCQGYAKPSWQKGFGTVNDGVRDIPDVSLFAANGVWSHFYLACDSAGGSPCTAPPSLTNWFGAGGTSFSSPILAGMQALVNQVNGSRQGNPNVVYYQLGANEYGSSGNASCDSTLGNAVASNCVFYDVTLGNMDVDCVGSFDCYAPDGKSVGVLSTSDTSYQPAYASGPGWDMATGLGTVNAYNLVNQWSTVAPRASGDK
jgi:subtilase family serine protease